MSVAGVILSGGSSTRMGTPKALLDYRGAPFIVRILEAFEALDLKTRVMVLGSHAVPIRTAITGHDCLIVENPDPTSEQIGSLRRALEALASARPAAALVWPVDLPHVHLSTVERLLEDYRRNHGAITLPTFAGRRGHPVIWDARLFEELLSSPAAEREGARAVVHAHEAELRVVAVDDPAIVDAIDTPEDYERLIREINRDAY